MINSCKKFFFGWLRHFSLSFLIFFQRLKIFEICRMIERNLLYQNIWDKKIPQAFLKISQNRRHYVWYALSMMLMAAVFESEMDWCLFFQFINISFWTRLNAFLKMHQDAVDLRMRLDAFRMNASKLSKCFTGDAFFLKKYLHGKSTTFSLTSTIYWSWKLISYFHLRHVSLQNVGCHQFSHALHHVLFSKITEVFFLIGKIRIFLHLRSKFHVLNCKWIVSSTEEIVSSDQFSFVFPIADFFVFWSTRISFLEILFFFFFSFLC